MAKIKSPNPHYNGNSASLQFINGEAETENKWLIEWFKNKGYTVEESKEPKKKNSGQTKAKKPEGKKDE
ncbi:hypothetical protein J7I93_08730 [Bacillus sp. ISL-47]|uniref:hypothetical protein n=1 Tax=Bacillus sp. ISL-47 TaxID=2819130 RepID=UPI001BE82E02|nr:hypothetical protein [Bacillus sp. ISL-47]MBT2688264.1 hypothetical protein [Bacillus sp. ISL-47]MBT2710057.1 hypothetical protein [Pseudomonas sp. ISL-84]